MYPSDGWIFTISSVTYVSVQLLLLKVFSRLLHYSTKGHPVCKISSGVWHIWAVHANKVQVIRKVSASSRNPSSPFKVRNYRIESIGHNLNQIVLKTETPKTQIIVNFAEINSHRVTNRAV